MLLNLTITEFWDLTSFYSGRIPFTPAIIFMVGRCGMQWGLKQQIPDPSYVLPLLFSNRGCSPHWEGQGTRALPQQELGGKDVGLFSLLPPFLWDEKIGHQLSGNWDWPGSTISFVCSVAACHFPDHRQPSLTVFSGCIKRTLCLLVALAHTLPSVWEKEMFPLFMT